MNLLAPEGLRGFFYCLSTKVVGMDLVLWIIFLWLLTNVVLGVILFLVTWVSGKFGKSKPGQLSSNDAKQSSEESPSLGERDQDRKSVV